MTSHSNFDRESLQKLLSNAFVVQESGMDTESLSAIVELQGSIATGELDVDGAMDLIAVRARNVANATGIAIGLLEGDQLVYRAGSGSAATYVGQHVMATLCVSTHNAASSEILRVENAQTDARIEAAICRQLGAQSLLILPIYHDRAVAGVLEVLFIEAHAFQPREVRSYRLMAGLVEEAMSDAARPEQEKALVVDQPTMRQSIGQIRPQIEKSLNDGGSVPGAATNRAICRDRGNSSAEAGKLPELRKSAWAYRDHRPASTVGVLALQRSNAIEQQMPFVPAKRFLANSTSKPQTALGLKKEEKKAVRTMKHWVRVGNNELDYVTQDVTVRYFTPKRAPQRVLDRNNRVRHISEDVTVRYFTPKHVVAPSPRPVGNAAQPVSR